MVSIIMSLNNNYHNYQIISFVYILFKLNRLNNK